MTTKIYGIKNCDTMKKALKWLDENGVTYDFHDYKKDGVDTAILQKALVEHGWEKVLNQRGTTWRQLPDDTKSAMSDQIAIEVAGENASVIKRPLLQHDGATYLGFKAEIYSEIFG